jgi:Kdo2-lipid IVA lauroyltransferase/acyltransferase
MRFYTEYYLVKGFLFLTKLLPNRTVYALCKAIANLFFKLDKRRRTLTLKNLHYAYPEKSNDEIFIIAQKAYESVAITLAETLLMVNDKLDIDGMIANKEEIETKFQHYFADKNRGKVLITGHFSNWELLAQFLAKSGYPIKNIARAGNNHLIDERIIQSFRGKYGNKNIPKKNAIVSLVKTLKQGLQTSILFDQKPAPQDSVEALFFGHPVRTVDVIARLKLKYNPLIVPVFIARRADGKYNVIMKDPIDYIAEEESEPLQKIMKMTQTYNDTIETIIRTYPEQWFWMHDRWRLGK